MTSGGDRSELPGWARDPQALEDVYREALRIGDQEAVEASLVLLALVDPVRAAWLLDQLQASLVVVGLIVDPRAGNGTRGA
jgi:hypothetical protein